MAIKWSKYMAGTRLGNAQREFIDEEDFSSYR